MPGKMATLPDWTVVRDGRNAGSTAQPACGLRGTPQSATVYAVPEFIWGMSIYPAMSGVRAIVSCSPSLDRPAGRFPGCIDQSGPCGADRLMSSIGGLLPIALWGRSSL
jgi:hypothetical protein